MQGLQHANPDMVLTAKRTLELANTAYFQYLTQNPAEQGRLLKKVLLNCRVDGVSLYPTYRKPFDMIFERAKTNEWSGREDLNLRPPAPKAGALPGCATPRQDEVNSSDYKLPAPRKMRPLRPCRIIPAHAGRSLRYCGVCPQSRRGVRGKPPPGAPPRHSLPACSPDHPPATHPEGYRVRCPGNGGGSLSRRQPLRIHHGRRGDVYSHDSDGFYPGGPCSLPHAGAA